ncbi:MAG: PAS domain-containing protein [Candidatus Marinimicrobia bacterium]|nr:PAS domain-containing protein [Candidatus Neomarinimicrobiota bacterium]
MNIIQQKLIIPFRSSLNRLAKIFKLRNLEEELELANSYLSIALKSTECGKWNWHMFSDQVELSPNAQAILGYEKKEKILKQKSFLEMIHPEDKASFLYEIEKHKSDVTDYVTVDIRMKSAYGYWNWINMRGKIVEFDRNGLPLIFAGINYDINEQKQYDNDVEMLQKKVNKSQDKKNIEKESIAYINQDLDNYSKFRRHGLKNLLN